jgi:hypothetical protein
MTLRLIAPSKLKLSARPPAPPIKRRKVDDPKPLTEETKRKLLIVSVLNTKLWSN